MINRNQTQEQLLRTAIRSIIREDQEKNQASKIRRLSTYPALSEDYVVRVLGFNRTLIMESRWEKNHSDEILVEHLLFEGFWSDAKEKLLDKIKNNPIKDVMDAVKRFGNGVDGVVAALTAVVDSGGDAMEVLVSGAKNLLSKSTADVSKSLRKMGAKIKEAGKSWGQRRSPRKSPRR